MLKREVKTSFVKLPDGTFPKAHTFIKKKPARDPKVYNEAMSHVNFFLGVSDVLSRSSKYMTHPPQHFDVAVSTNTLNLMITTMAARLSTPTILPTPTTLPTAQNIEPAMADTVGRRFRSQDMVGNADFVPITPRPIRGAAITGSNQRFPSSNKQISQAFNHCAKPGTTTDTSPESNNIKGFLAFCFLRVPGVHNEQLHCIDCKVARKLSSEPRDKASTKHPQAPTGPLATSDLDHCQPLQDCKDGMTPDRLSPDTQFTTQSIGGTLLQQQPHTVPGASDTHL